jgi:hypothetical protein
LQVAGCRLQVVDVVMVEAFVAVNTYKFVFYVTLVN